MHAVFRALQRLLAFSIALAWVLAPQTSVGIDPAWGNLAFEIVDSQGSRIPGRLTLVSEDDPGASVELRPVDRASPLVVRPNTVSTLQGKGQVQLPAGGYRVHASRGLEWSADMQEIEVRPGAVTRLRAILHHEVDTRGWTSADLHVHTRPYSDHGDARLPERIVTLASEGIEFAVPTDHNHHTDWTGAVAKLGAGPFLSTVSGNEVSANWGHVNVLPVDEEQEPVSPKQGPRQLLPRLRETSEPEKDTVLIQINHPRSGVAAYFSQSLLDPVTAIAGNDHYDPGFDAIEVLNGKDAAGYRVPGESLSTFSPSVLEDWYNFLNRGHRYVAVGNSDSHSVAEDPVGYPRNFIRTPDETTPGTSETQILSALRKGRSFTTLGPFVELRVDGSEIGSDMTSQDGEVNVSIRVQAANWVDVDRVRLVVNGDVVEEIPVAASVKPTRIDTQRRIALANDSWISLEVTGDQSLSPIVPDGENPTLPIAVTNPVWVHVGKPGEWVSPWQQALDEIAAGLVPPVGGEKPPAPASLRALRRLAAGELKVPQAARWVTTGLADPSPKVRLAAARAAQSLALPRLIPALDRALSEADSDYEEVAILRAIAATDAGLYRRRIVAKARETGTSGLRPWGNELRGLSPETRVGTWNLSGAYRRGPKAPPLAVLAQSAFPKADDTRLPWREVKTGSDGYVDLLADVAPASRGQNSFSYARIYLFVDKARHVPVALGSDDGIQVYLEDEQIFSDPERHRATPWQHFLELPLEAGWNRVTLAITNNVGGSGFYFQLLDENVEASIAPE